MNEELKNIENLRNKFENWEPEVSTEEVQHDWEIVKSKISPSVIHLNKFHGLKYILYSGAGIITIAVVYMIYLNKPAFKRNSKTQETTISHQSNSSNLNNNTLNEKEKNSISNNNQGINLNKIASKKNTGEQEKSGSTSILTLPFVKEKEVTAKENKASLGDIIKNSIVKTLEKTEKIAVTQSTYTGPVVNIFPEVIFGNYQLISKGKINIYDTVICIDDSVQIVSEASGQLSVILPDNNIITSVQNKISYRFTKPGEYFIDLKYTEDGKESVKKQRILVVAKPEANFSSDNANTPDIRFNNESKKASKYYWHFGDDGTSTIENPVHKYFDTGFYQVTLIAQSKGACSDTNTKLIHVFVEPELLIPNVFTPNNDGENDKYKINIKGEVFYQLYIYDVNNSLVFTGNDKNEAWDGKLRGRDCPNGTYYYILRYQLVGQDKIHKSTGTITLLR